MSEARRIVDIVRDWAERAPHQVCLTFYEREAVAEQATYGALWREVSRFAALYRAHGLAPGEAVVIFAHSALAFVSAFLGAQQTGLLAVPCPPPESLASGRRVDERVTQIMQRCDARVLVSPAAGPKDAELAAILASKRQTLLTPADLDEAPAVPPAAVGGPFAYCQFTSGSGGRAKGVLLTHENLLASVSTMHETFRTPGQVAAVSWLPLFHDMGLVAYVLMPLVLGYPSHLMPPLAFLARPASWLSLISRVRATRSAAPNFAYALCARRISDEECTGLDLSSWRAAFNGAEPVTPETVAAFTRRFAPYGFDPGAMLPCYGLAEDTLCVTSRRPGEGARFEEVGRDELERTGVARSPRVNEPARTMTSVGQALPDHAVQILDADGAALPDRRVGEVAVRSPSVMHGYLPGTEGEVVLTPDGWLLTGDLGYLADGELFIVGRKKDLIIRAGRNYYPQDLEEAAARVPGVRPGRSVAFGIVDPTGERVVLAIECHQGWTGESELLRRQIRDAVFASVGFPPDEIVLRPAHTLPLTSSGKVMRPAARALYAKNWDDAG